MYNVVYFVLDKEGNVFNKLETLNVIVLIALEIQEINLNDFLSNVTLKYQLDIFSLYKFCLCLKEQFIEPRKISYLQYKQTCL